MTVVYSLSNLEKLIWYIVVPLLVLMIIFSCFCLIYNLKNKDKYPNKTNYVVNYWSAVLGIIFGAILLAVSLGFSAAFIQTVRDLNAIAQNRFFYYFFMFFPIIPCTFLVIFIMKFVTNLNKHYIVEEEEERVNEGQ